MNQSHHEKRSSHQKGTARGSSRAVLVNGERLQALRLQAGLTQEELAAKTGYSDRLIRKAEASGPLRFTTIADLAAAISSPTLTVTTDDLVLSPEPIARELTLALVNPDVEQLEKRAIPNCHRDVQLAVHGDASEIPFAGHFVGPAGLLQFHRQFHRTLLVCPQSNEVQKTFISSRGACLQLSSQILHPSGTDQALVWWIMTLSFEASRVRSADLLYDTGRLRTKFQMKHTNTVKPSVNQ
jgi:transcriptional regulator with XRE-family HTH domain